MDIPACVISHEYFMRTSQYLGFEWNELLQRHLRNRAGRNFCDHLASEFKNAEMDLKSTTTNRFNLRIMTSLMESLVVA